MLNSNNHLLSRSKKEIMVQKNHKKNFNNTRRNVRMIKGNNIVDLFSEFQSNPNNHYAIGYDLNNLNKLTFSMMDFMVFLKKARRGFYLRRRPHTMDQKTTGGIQWKP